MESLIKKIGLLLLIVAILTFSSIFVAVIISFSGSTVLESGNVAVIPLYGVIASGEDYWESTIDPDYVREAIQDASDDPSIKAIVLEINSPGGTVVPTDEISQALKATNKTTVAWIRDLGASGGYWIASNADYIIANRMSITGSVGVTSSYINFAGTLRRYNATYEQFTAGKNKEIGSPLADMTPEQEAILRKKLEMIHEFFLDEVQTNRNITDAAMARVRTGEYLLGVEAYELGLVDELGGIEQVEAYLTNTIGEEPVFVHYRKPQTLLESIGFVKASNPFGSAHVQIKA